MRRSSGAETAARDPPRRAPGGGGRRRASRGRLRSFSLPVCARWERCSRAVTVGPVGVAIEVSGGRERGARFEILGMALAAIAIRVAVFALDRQPRFFLGDSASYLDTAIGRWVPPDRSWLYGLGLNALLRSTHHLAAMIAVQGAFSAAACVATAGLLRALGARRWIAWAALLLHGADPLWHYYDRSVLTDGPGAAAIWIGVALVAVALARNLRSAWIAAVLFLWVTICLRTALLPLLLFAPAFALSVRAWHVLRAARGVPGAPGEPWRARLRPLAGPAALAAGIAAGLVAYAVATGAVVGARPALNPKAGYFLIGQVAPILAPEDFRRLGIADPGALLRETRAADYTLRNWQVFDEQGLALRMERELGDWRRTSRAARIAARRSIVRDPVGFARLAATCGAEYLRLGVDPGSFAGGFGLDRPLPDTLVASLRAKVDDDVDAHMVARPSPVLSAIRPWSHVLPIVSWLALLVPVAVLLPGRRSVAAGGNVVTLLGASSLIYSAFLFAASVGFTQRYLLPFTPLVLSLLGLWAEGRLRRRGRSVGAA